MDPRLLALGFAFCAIGGFFLTPLLFIVAAVLGALYAIQLAIFIWRWPFG